MRIRAVTRLPKGIMNKTEAEYAQSLEYLKKTGRVLWYKFEAIKFRLADSTFYTPDFIVMPADLTLEAHEVKGFWRDDARVKIKVAADIYQMIKFIAVKKVKNGWQTEEF
jgi:UDP-N-acetylenolpyruvoylglucosamine reductase